MQGQAFTGQMANQAANLNAQRGMALNAQQNAAQNVSNQLSTLRDRASSGAQAITSAMNTAAGMYR